jgi:hypothetical protein
VKVLRSLISCALVLSFVPSLAWADEPSLAERAQRRVEAGLVKPLAQQEKPSRFSRARPAPRERRVRITETTATSDKKGKAFVPFAIDVRFGGSEWHENDITGCVYTASGELFVKNGDSFRPAAFLLGKNVEPVAGVCEGARQGQTRS